jgi:hypothetical protein
VSGINKYNLSWNLFNEEDGYLLQESLHTQTKIIMFDIQNNPVKFTTIDIIAG